MLHILKDTSSPQGAIALRGMFEARKRVFVDLLGWDVPVLAGRYEVDQFDNVHCAYLVLADSAGAHFASARLLPTERPHILDSLYPHLCDGPPPRGPDIFEITRFCLERDLPTRDRRRARDTLICGLVDHALDNGIRAYSAIAEQRWLDQIGGFGWRCRRLGPEQREGTTDLGAVEILISEETPRLLREAGLVPDDTLNCALERTAA
jgi:N-acyl-L-homoserine lactone synthetase